MVYDVGRFEESQEGVERMWEKITPRPECCEEAKGFDGPDGIWQMKVKITEIEIPERFRVEYGDLKDLAESIDRYGLIQPIVVDKTTEGKMVLVAGCRRLLATQQLGYEEIVVTFYENLDPVSRREIELEENIKRKQFTWAEEVRAKAELVQIRKGQATQGLWGEPRVGKEVAEELGVSEATISQDLELARALKLFPDLAKEETKSGAMRRLRLLKQTVAMETLAEAAHLDKEKVQLFNGDCLEVLKRLPTGSVDLVVTDPPWGVDIGESGGMEYEEKFEDGVVESFELLRNVAAELCRVVKDGSHVYVFFATKYFCEVKKVLEEGGLGVNAIPLIWWKKSGLNLLPDKRFTYDYETIFFCWKGKQRGLVQPCRAVFEYSVPAKKVHPTQKPVELIERLVEVGSVKGELVLDPFAGSGSTIRAALNLERKAVGVELNEAFFNHMKVWCGEGGEK